MDSFYPKMEKSISLPFGRFAFCVLGRGEVKQTQFYPKTEWSFFLPLGLFAQKDR